MLTRGPRQQHSYYVTAQAPLSGPVQGRLALYTPRVLHPGPLTAPCRHNCLLLQQQHVVQVAGNHAGPLSTSSVLRQQPTEPLEDQLDQDEVWVPFRWPGQLGGNKVSISGSFCDWQHNHTDLAQAWVSSHTSYPADWVGMYKFKVGQHEYKYNVDGVWKAAPADPLVMDPEGNINNKRLCVKNCHLEFSFRPGSIAARSLQTVVKVTGSWSNWQIATPMQREGSNKWVTDISLPVRVGVAPAFYLFYATGWKHCTLMYKLLKDGQPIDPEWQHLAMDDSPSRAEPSGEGSRWKQAIVALPAGVMEQDRDKYGLQFFMQGPQVGGSSDRDSPSSTSIKAAATLKDGSTGMGRQSGEPAQLPEARWHACLSAGGKPEDLKSQVKVDAPDKAGKTTYLLRWPGGWKLQNGTITKFNTMIKPPVLLCSDIDGTMVNEHTDKKEQFWMDNRTKEFQEYWESSAALARSVLVYNTGRSKGQLIWLLKEKPMLAVPDVLITAVGTKIWYLPDGMRAFQDPTVVDWIEDTRWSERLDEGWDLQQALSAAGEMFKVFNRDAVEHVKWLDKGEEHPHRVALQVNTQVLDELVDRLLTAIDKRQLQSRIITSGAGDWRYVDVVHKLAGKLEALEWVRQVYGVPVERCVTAGDSCNDILMLDGKMPAVVVGNAQEELVSWYHEQNDRGRIVLTDKPEAAGVLEGLARHGLYG
eukprot:GHRR01015079.1.p1 GENE.GHRR01015079.1~~GHRR01015079.1.p1  ORF type:complete len:701 (+),score=242.04 GHRR01015079.1:231-2333(+)